MRPLERIPRILKLLEELWRIMPDQRFGQLLINSGIVADDFSTWNNSDDDLESVLKEKLKEWKK